MQPERAGDVEIALDAIHVGDCRELMAALPAESIDLSIWSPPYFVGKSYEEHLRFEEWELLLRETVAAHARILRPGRFVAINIADILCFPDASLPRYQADVVSTKRSPVTREQVLAARTLHPDLNRYQLAALLGCSEQTIQRRLDHNNVRGGKYATQTRVMPVAGLVEDWAREAGLVLYDRRIWAKDPAWANSRWHSLSYRAVDEFEYVFVLWKPGITRVDRGRLSAREWREWGSRGVWQMASVRSNDDHEAKFPDELPRRLVRLLSDPGDVVLDPFVGSGTTACVAIEEGRRYLGFELLPRYAELARSACAAARREPASR
jgi:site-specific DNA-methyltransferase (adenine-specific)